MERIEDFKDIIHEELIDNANSITPPTSNESARHLPTGGLLEVLIIYLLIPIIVSVIYKFIEKYLIDRKKDREVKDKLSSLEAQLTELKNNYEHHLLEEKFNTIIMKVFEISNDQTKGLIQESLESKKIKLELVNILKKFNLGEETSQNIINLIVSRLKENLLENDG